MPQSKQKAKAAAKQRVRSAADAAEEKAKQAASKKASRKAPVGAAVDEAPPPTPPLPARASRKRKPSARQQDAAAAMEEAADDSDDDALAVPVYDDDDDDEGSDDVEPREAPARRVAADADRRLSEADIMRLADEMMAKQLQARLNRGEDEGQPDAMEQDHQGKKLGGDETAETRAFAKAGEVAASARDGTDALRMLQVWGKPGDVAKFLRNMEAKARAPTSSSSDAAAWERITGELVHRLMKIFLGGASDEEQRLQYGRLAMVAALTTNTLAAKAGQVGAALTWMRTVHDEEDGYAETQRSGATIPMEAPSLTDPNRLREASAPLAKPAPTGAGPRQSLTCGFCTRTGHEANTCWLIHTSALAPTGTQDRLYDEREDMLHMLRNAADRGVESAARRLDAYRDAKAASRMPTSKSSGGGGPTRGGGGYGHSYGSGYGGGYGSGYGSSSGSGYTGYGRSSSSSSGGYAPTPYAGARASTNIPGRVGGLGSAPAPSAASSGGSRSSAPSGGGAASAPSAAASSSSSAAVGRGSSGDGH